MSEELDSAEVTKEADEISIEAHESIVRLAGLEEDEGEARNNIYKKVKGVIGELDKRMIEREELTRLVILALLSRSHIFLIGKPGVGKTFIIEMLKYVIKDSKYFEFLVMRHTKPEEIFGSVIEHADGSLEYITENTALDANIIFMDELFKGTAAILNSFLSMLSNARNFFMRGVGEIHLKHLIMFVGASNEFPSVDELAPFDDRLLIRNNVLRIQKRSNRIRMLKGDFVKDRNFKNQFTFEELDTIEEGIDNVIIPDPIMDTYETLVTAILKDGIDISDRKFYSAVRIFKASAYLNGRSSLDISDLFILMHVGWKDFTDERKLKEVIWKHMFSSDTHLRKRLLDNESAFDDLNSYYKVNLKAFVHGDVRFDMMDDNDCRTFEQYTNNYNEFHRQLTDVAGQYTLLFEFRVMVDKIEKLIDKNIFLIEYRNTTFVPDVVEMLNNGYEKASDLLEIFDNNADKANSMQKYLTNDY